MDKKPLLESWREFAQYLKSPNSFIDMSFYYMIGASLQRRVWIGSCDMPIFPNQYIILVGEPGIGKGLVIKPAASILKYHKLHTQSYEENLKPKVEEITPERFREIQEWMKTIDELRADHNKTKKNYINDEPLLFPTPAEASTYEALVEANANANRLFKVPPEQKYIYRDIVPKSGIYSHSSLNFLLEELSSLFCKNAEKLVNYLLVTWDCGDYTYATKHHGVDKIRNCCLNMLAGTTPGFMRDTFTDKLVDEGFSARAIFVYEDKNRFSFFGVPNYSNEQIEAKQKIINRIKSLSTLFGQCHYTPDAHECLKNYFEKELPNTRINDSVKLQPYYSKKDQHVQKLAMAIHFADNDDKVIGLHTVKKALEILAELEVKMHYALGSGSKNIQGVAARKILKYLASTHPVEKSRHDLWTKALEGDIRDTELQEVLSYLISTDQIDIVRKENKNFYKLRKAKI